MGVYIKGMTMPTSCSVCPIGNALCCSLMPGVPALWKEYEVALKTNRRHENCPLVPISPHGRLIDADALNDECVPEPTFIAEMLFRKLNNAPTIIEAEEDD